ncbi:dTMP kinase [Streptomyces sp. NPDC000349]|uniref:dTMP kinase n=1 Tax=unclassified Streptomyces TaxID=2593676 RepID=UPI00278678B9|nr:dTMP kinase [Streptomyces sp. DSM 40167]MDQ0408826.1 dTMP kinase [Streptomyces sp. DSM 40167]
MLIAFEGLPGAGKTTQSRLLADHLTREQVPVNYLPDNLTRTEDTLGSTLLELFASGDPFSRHGNVVTDTMLATAIRTNTVATHITPALIEDRGIHTIQSCSLATLLQKHPGRPGDGIGWLRSVSAMSGPPADVAVWLRLPADGTIARAARREGQPYTAEQHAFLRHVHDAYGHLAADDPGLVTVDVLGLTPAQVHQAVVDAIAEHVPIPAPAEHSSSMQ